MASISSILYCKQNRKQSWHLYRLLNCPKTKRSGLKCIAGVMDVTELRPKMSVIPCPINYCIHLTLCGFKTLFSTSEIANNDYAMEGIVGILHGRYKTDDFKE